MALLFEYTLKDASYAADQSAAMQKLMAAAASMEANKTEYVGYSTADPTRFIAVFTFASEHEKQQFVTSDAVAAYIDTVKDWLAEPPKTTEISAL